MSIRAEPAEVGLTAGLAPPDGLRGRLSAARFAVVDVETSGLRPERHRLLQIGVVLARSDGSVVQRWDTLLRAPWRPLGARQVHGLSRRALRGAPPLRAVTGELARALDGAILVAHNVAFDWPFLVVALRRAGYAAPDALRFCTLELSRSLDLERARSHRLQDLCRHYHVPLARPHDAAHDAAATAALLPHLFLGAGIEELSQLRPLLSGATRRWPTPAEAQIRRRQLGWPR